jgi:hypothetical protein
MVKTLDEAIERLGSGEMSAGEAQSVLDAPKHWHSAEARRRAEQRLTCSNDPKGGD